MRHLPKAGEQQANATPAPSVPSLQTGGTIAAIIPRDIEQVFRLATAISKSGLAPQDMRDPEKLVVAIMHGLEIGLPPMQAVQRIAIIGGRPAIWGDAIPALLWAKGFQIIETISDGVAECTVVRPNGSRITRTFSTADAQRAGLLGKAGPWRQYPQRMLQMRARGYACRDGAADALSGLYIAEELIDVTPHEKPAASVATPVDTEAERANKLASLKKLIGTDAATMATICQHFSVETLDDLAGQQIERAICGLKARARRT